MSTEFYDTMKDALPNVAHLAIKTLEETGKLLAIVTQNIDHLHHKAGNSPEKIIELHGTAFSVSCLSCGKMYDRDKIHYHTLSLKKINQIYANLCDLDLEKRKDVVGLEPERADIIIGGTAILLEILSQLDKDSIIVSEQDILDGIIYTLVKF